jgi:hypothetical protein
VGHSGVTTLRPRPEELPRGAPYRVLTRRLQLRTEALGPTSSVVQPKSLLLWPREQSRLNLSLSRLEQVSSVAGVFHQQGVTESSRTEGTTSECAERVSLRQVEDVQRAAWRVGLVPGNTPHTAPEPTAQPGSRHCTARHPGHP